SLAFSGVGVGSIILFPWIQTVIVSAGWRTACWMLGLLVLVVLVPLNLLVRHRPEDLGLQPDGDPASRIAAGGRPANGVDPAWAAVEGTLGGGMAARGFWG